MPVLNRPMFNAPSPSMGGGISTVPRPEVEAQNLRTLFGPAQPVQPFRRGGEVINGVKHFQGGGANNITEEELARVQDREARRRFDIDDTESRTIAAGRSVPPNISDMYPRPPSYPTGGPPVERTPMDLSFGMPMEGGRMFNMDETISGPAAPAPRSVAPGPSISPEDVARMRDRDIAEESSTYAARQGQAAQALAQRAPPPPPAPEPVKPKGELELSLEAIRSRRSEDRKENALLALMQAGFATAAGRSPSALTNIGAGGQAGIAAFAGMEKGSREDQRAAMQDLAMRRREISSEKLARDLATQKMEQDPDQIRTYAILGGWVPGQSKEAYQQAVTKGYSATQAKDAPRLATAILANPLITQNYTPEELKTLADVARRGVVEMGSSGGFPGFKNLTPR